MTKITEPIPWGCQFGCRSGYDQGNLLRENLRAKATWESDTKVPRQNILILPNYSGGEWVAGKTFVMGTIPDYFEEFNGWDQFGTLVLVNFVRISPLLQG